MGTVIDVHGSGKAGLDAATDERLSGQYLADRPLSASVGDNEQVAFVIVNKRGGVTVERKSGSESYKPGRNYRTLVAVTDVRLLIAVGGAGESGDRIVSVPLSTITGVDTESSFLGGALVVATDAGERWSIPCRDDLDPVVSYLQHAKRAWSKVDRLLAEVDERIGAAEDRLETGDHEGALEAADDAISVVAHAREELGTFEMGRGVVANADFERREASIRTVQRRVHAGVASEQVEQARDTAEADRYREAHDHFERARAACERALAIDADEPSEDDLTERQGEIERELRDLEGAPAAAAADVLDEAREIDDPSERAAALEDALEAQRDLLGLCWGPEAAFDGDPEEIRERIVAIVEEILAARLDAVRRSLVAADRLDVRDRGDDALAECARATEHIDAARAVARELLPERVEALDTWAETVDEQRARVQKDDSGTTAAVSGVSSDAAAAGPTTAESTEPTDAVVAGIATVDDASAGSEDDTGPPVAGEEIEPESLAERLATLDKSAFTSLIADVWRDLGWRTTAFTESIDQYDVMATRADPVELRMLIWAVHRPDGDLDTAVVDRCATDRANVDRADVAALVTTGAVPEAVRERASEHNVKLLERTDLLDLLEREQLAHLIDGLRQ
ncbi:restriction endonuclease [Halapricum salinum]|uniref:Restriction endonuclease type IV Mrr domain-containing protein n=1 Tax=Halapricum salinum TaxID=1457250 RepID=A0A4D6HAG0_9EURY|nr:restriction endonuclease [Halapricum salinum]QCC50635.1 hypothetical protein DV733_04970 [Halapricum salinum]